MRKIADFYSKYFGFEAVFSAAQDKAILSQPDGGMRLVLLQASKGHRIGQSCVKLIFDVADVAGFKEEQSKLGLKFGPIHHGPNYVFSNARDPARNLIQISDGFLVDRQRANKALEPTRPLVTPPAEPGGAPSGRVAHL